MTAGERLRPRGTGSPSVCAPRGRRRARGAAPGSGTTSTCSPTCCPRPRNRSTASAAGWPRRWRLRRPDGGAAGQRVGHGSPGNRTARATRRRDHQPVPVGDGRELGPRAGVELGQDVGDVPLDRAVADEQLCPDLTVGPADGRPARARRRSRALSRNRSASGAAVPSRARPARFRGRLRRPAAGAGAGAGDRGARAPRAAFARPRPAAGRPARPPPAGGAPTPPGSTSPEPGSTRRPPRPRRPRPTVPEAARCARRRATASAAPGRGEQQVRRDVAAPACADELARPAAPSAGVLGGPPVPARRDRAVRGRARRRGEQVRPGRWRRRRPTAPARPPRRRPSLPRPRRPASAASRPAPGGRAGSGARRRCAAQPPGPLRARCGPRPARPRRSASAPAHAVHPHARRSPRAAGARPREQGLRLVEAAQDERGRRRRRTGTRRPCGAAGPAARRWRCRVERHRQRLGEASGVEQHRAAG